MEKENKRMKVRILSSMALAASLSFGADYFPLEQGNSWTYSYVSSITVVTYNPPTTRDSGTVKWEIIPPGGGSAAGTTQVKQTRSLVRRVLTGIIPGYDSTFSPPRTTTDTVVFSDTPLQNALSFQSATCACALHDPARALPESLTVKDTTVAFSGSDVAGRKTVPSACSCTKNQIWSFVLADKLGPLEASITWCPGMAGTSFHETRKLVSRGYPSRVQRAANSPVNMHGVAVSYASGGIVCRLRGPEHAAGPVSVALLSLSGKTIDRFTFDGKAAGSLNTGSLPGGMYLLRVEAGGSVYTERFWLDRQ
jgi:hypothetical protein